MGNVLDASADIMEHVVLVLGVLDNDRNTGRPKC
jgi:hypothetical protein